MVRTGSRRMEQLEENYFAELEERMAALKAAGADIIRLDVGSPDLPPAAPILERLANEACRPDRHGYAPHAGPLILRQAWADMYERVHGVRLDPARHVAPLLGSKEGIFHLTQAWGNPGEVVIVPDPGYMTYARAARFAGAEVFPLPLEQQNGYLPDLALIPTQILQRARMMWLNYPNNPTGAVADLDDLQAVFRFCQENQILLCFDNAYAQITYDDYHAPSLLEIPGAEETAVEFNSLSKSHNMAGWRVGAALGNPAALQELFRLKSNLDSGHFMPIHLAAVEAMTGDQSWLAERNQVYRARRDAVIRGLAALGLQAQNPKGAIYVWCRVPDGFTSSTFTLAVLEQAHIGLTPGTVFGSRGEGYFRLALTEELPRIQAAMDRLALMMHRGSRRQS